MKKAFLLIVVPVLLAALAFAQTPAAGSNTDQTNIKGCLGGADGNYTVAEDNTGHVFKISTRSVDLKPHVGHDVSLIGQKAGEAASAAEANSFAVTELNMISEHCAAAAAAPAESAAAPAASDTTPTENAGAPAAAAATAAPVSTPAETAAAPAPVTTEPAATVTPAETAVTPAPPVTPVAPAPAAAEPAATGSAPAEIASAPPAASVHAKPVTAERKLAAKPAAAATKAAAPAATTSSEADSTPAAAATTPVATTSPDTNSAPAAAATTPAKPVKTGSFAIFIAFAVLVILLGILAPFLRRWRKRKMLEGTDAPNLSFTHDAKSDEEKDEEKSDPPVIRKAA